MNTVHNYIYAQQQMHFADMDYYEDADKSKTQSEELCEFFTDLDDSEEVHPMLGYYGC